MNSKSIIVNNSQNTNSIIEEPKEHGLFSNFTTIQQIGVEGMTCYYLKNFTGAKKACEDCLNYPEFIATLPSIQLVEAYSMLSQYCMRNKDFSRAMIYILISLDYAKNVPDTDPIKIDTVAFYKKLGSPEEILTKLLALLVPGASTISIKDVWRAIGILGQINYDQY